MTLLRNKNTGDRKERPLDDKVIQAVFVGNKIQREIKVHEKKPPIDCLVHEMLLNFEEN